MSLRKERLVEFENLFLEKKKELLKFDSKIELDVSGDSIDVIQGEMIGSTLEVLGKRNSNMLHKIDLALERIRKGEYGICEECGEDIPTKRLLACPETNTCVSCQERIEKLAREFVK
jgi:DnaK suppressor protein